jgi:dTDP-glucose 4,6-dehydratase
MLGDEIERIKLDMVKLSCGIIYRLRLCDQLSYVELISFVTDRPAHNVRYAIEPNHIRDKFGWMPSVPNRGKS